MPKAKKPRFIQFGGDEECFANVYGHAQGLEPSFTLQLNFTGNKPKDLRRLAKWATEAADWLSQQEEKDE